MLALKIHEYQAKDLLQQYGVPVPKGVVAESPSEALKKVGELGEGSCVVKAQIHAGGRGKGGGIQIVSSAQALSEAIRSMMGMRLVTHQTTSEGQLVQSLLVEELLDIESEKYLGIVVDRSVQQAVLIGSADGGVDIEQVAASSPDRIHNIAIDPSQGLCENAAASLAEKLSIPERLISDAVALFNGVYRAFWDNDASLAEINPLIVTADGRLVALDAKFNFDDSALFRQPGIEALRDPAEEDQDEIKASAHGLNYIALDGTIGCLVNGAGLAMATMDIIKFYGGEPANFLDVGGGATTEQVTEAFKLMLRNPNLRAILVNIFGGIMRCDVGAEGLVNAAREVNLNVPLVVRLEGTNVERGQEILAQSDISIISATNMSVAAQSVVAAAL